MLAGRCFLCKPYSAAVVFCTARRGLRTKKPNQKNQSSSSHQQKPKSSGREAVRATDNYGSSEFKSLWYQAIRRWPVRIGADDNEHTVNLVVGMSTARFVVETRLHALEHIVDAPDLWPDDLRRLFNYYRSKQPPKEEPIDVIEFYPERIVLLREGIRIKPPEPLLVFDKPSKRPKQKQDPDHIIMVDHNDFRANVLPHKKDILAIIKLFQKRVREAAIERIAHLLDESYAIEENLMNLDSVADSMNQVWNEDSGPLADARELQDRFNIKQHEIREFQERPYTVFVPEKPKGSQDSHERPNSNDV